MPILARAPAPQDPDSDAYIPPPGSMLAELRNPARTHLLISTNRPADLRLLAVFIGPTGRLPRPLATSYLNDDPLNLNKTAIF